MISLFTYKNATQKMNYSQTVAEAEQLVEISANQPLLSDLSVIENVALKTIYDAQYSVSRSLEIAGNMLIDHGLYKLRHARISGLSHGQFLTVQYLQASIGGQNVLIDSPSTYGFGSYRETINVIKSLGNLIVIESEDFLRYYLDMGIDECDPENFYDVTHGR